MDENIYQIAEQIAQLHQEAYEEKILGLYKRVCTKYLDVYPGCIRDYIEAYREMWGEEDSYSADFS